MLNSDIPASISIHYYNSHRIRAHIHSKTNQVWLVGADVCKALNITNPSKDIHLYQLKENNLLRGSALLLFMNYVTTIKLQMVNNSLNGIKQFKQNTY